MIIAAAEVNPDTTGTDTKSTKNPARSIVLVVNYISFLQTMYLPKCKIPLISSMHPDRKHKRIARAGSVPWT